MFTQIFKNELLHAFRQPANWLFALLFFTIGFAAMAIGGDILDERNVEKGTELFANSHLSINTLFQDLTLLILVLLPAVVGGTVYRDFTNKMHLVLFSYPFTKGQYLGAKFAASMVVMIIILGATGIGLLVAEGLPFPHENMLGATSFEAYFRTYFIYIFPNLFIFGGIIFTVVALSRNIYAGLATVILLVLLRAVIGSFLGGIDNFWLASILDPYGEATVTYHIRYWTLAEQNSQLIPSTGPVILNRIFWLGVAGIIGFQGYRKFELEQEICFRVFKRKSRDTRRKKGYAATNSSSQPKITLDFSFFERLKSIWYLSGFEFNYLVRSRSFLAVLGGSFVFMFVLLSQVNPELTTRIKPLTQVMIFIPTFFFSMVIVLLTFLYSGMLIHRARMEKFDSILDATPVSDWQSLSSKFLALIKMQMLLLSVIMIVGISVQAMRGHYNFEFGVYIFDLYVRALPDFIIWTFLAIFIQTLLPNPMVNTFLLLLIFFSISGLDNLGIEDDLLKYNSGPVLQYSDINGYGPELAGYFLLKIYWFFGGLMFFFGAFLFWNRGLKDNFYRRFRCAVDRFRGKTRLGSIGSFLVFLMVGTFIFYEKNVKEKPLSAEAVLKNKYESEIKYAKFKSMTQPRISGAKINMHLFPETRDYQSDGEFVLKNKSNRGIDTILVNTSFEDLTEVSLNVESERVISDSVVHFQVFKLKNSLLPGDSLKLFFEMKNRPNSIFKINSQIAENGTFFVPNFPTVGAPEYEITNAERRKEFGLPKRVGMPLPPKNITDRTPIKDEILANYYAGKNIDFINFESTVSTSSDQIALAPGQLQNEWSENNRRFFHYKTQSPIRNGIVFNSGRFAVKKDNREGVDLEIYYHPAHDFNLESMMKGMKTTLEFCSENFAPYQFRQMRIIEFPKSYGRFAQSFAGSIPYSEFAGFITNVDSSAQKRYDSPFRLTTHEMSHQWWGHSVVPAGVRGSKLVTEGLAEYTSLRILEEQYGVDRMRIFLNLSREAYLRGRANKKGEEQPLWCAEYDQNYLNYNKGALAFYTVSNYLGKDVFHNMLKTYVENVRFQNAPYTTSVELIEIIREGTPDSLQYLIDDLFVSSVLYDNRIIDARALKTEKGKFKVEIEFLVSKYKSGKGGERVFDENEKTIYQTNGSETITSLPLKDYVEIGIFSERGKEIYLRKHKITEVRNQLSIVVDELPDEVGVDPWLKLIDLNGADNRRKID